MCIGCRRHLTVHGPIQGFQSHHGSIAEGRQRRTPGTVPEGVSKWGGMWLLSWVPHWKKSQIPCWVPFLDTLISHEKWQDFVPTNQQSQIQKWPKNGDVLWRSNIANKKPHPRRFSNIYSLLKVCWGNGNLNQLENFIVIFLALLCDLAWMVEWPLLKGCWWTTQPFGDTKGSRIESPGIHLRNSAIQLEGLSYFLICFLFVFGLFCWSCMSCCVIF